jgi:hypothetical protein
MRKEVFRSILSALFVAVFMFQSCGNIDIVKRRYRPGFHVYVTKKKQQSQHVLDDATALKSQSESVPIKAPKVQEERLEAQPIQKAHGPVFSASISPTPEKKTGIDKVNDFMLTPFREIKQEKLNGKLRRAVFNKDDEEKYGWSLASFLSTGFGIVALALLITGIIFFVSFMLGGAFVYWWAFLAAAIPMGIAAMVTGIVGMRQTGSGERRGRGFAIAGLVSGIITLAGGLISLLWGFLYTIINGGSGDDF